MLGRPPKMRAERNNSRSGDHQKEKYCDEGKNRNSSSGSGHIQVSDEEDENCEVAVAQDENCEVNRRDARCGPLGSEGLQKTVGFLKILRQGHLRPLRPLPLRPLRPRVRT